MTQPTSIDHKNAQNYALMKISFNKTNKINATTPGVSWYSNPPGSTYPSLHPLDCPDGLPVLSTKEQCMASSKWDKDPTSIPNVPPSLKNGYYLVWKDNTCFIGNHLFRNDCMSGFPDGSEPNKSIKAFPKFDKDNQRCLITQDYCNKFSYDSYTPGDLPNGDGGTCKLSTGLLVTDALFGDTITKGVFEGGCF